MDEIWKNIRGYEGLYEVSNQGRVRSLNRTVPRGRSNLPIRGITLKIKPGKRGYVYAKLYRNSKLTTKPIHRLVAMAFIENPNNHKELNHINGNKADNRFQNLEWCSRRHNLLHSYKTGLRQHRYHLELCKKLRDEYDGNYTKLAKKYNIPSGGQVKILIKNLSLSRL